ncbi:MAG: hypothetical protein Ct9H300mP1_12080 [Planctomycetaceae bacterium]|nr:MAG: hypothetical protein Ct9H300mP1_12080 [Planctomycetaceae bacterium]
MNCRPDGPCGDRGLLSGSLITLLAIPMSVTLFAPAGGEGCPRRGSARVAIILGWLIAKLWGGQWTGRNHVMMSDDREPQTVGPASVRDRLGNMLAVARSAMDPRRWLIGGPGGLDGGGRGVVLDNWSGAPKHPAEWPWDIGLGTLDGDRKGGSLLSEVSGQPIATAVRVAWNPELEDGPCGMSWAGVRIVGAGSWPRRRLLVAIPGGSVVWSLAGVILVRMTAPTWFAVSRCRWPGGGFWVSTFRVISLGIPDQRFLFRSVWGWLFWGGCWPRFRQSVHWSSRCFGLFHWCWGC